MSVLTANSRRDLEIHRYPVPLYLAAPIFALVLQALLPRVVGRFAYFDLPLVITIYFALGRRFGFRLGSCARRGLRPVRRNLRRGLTRMAGSKPVRMLRRNNLGHLRSGRSRRRPARTARWDRSGRAAARP